MKTKFYSAYKKVRDHDTALGYLFLDASVRYSVQVRQSRSPYQYIQLSMSRRAFKAVLKYVRSRGIK